MDVNEKTVCKNCADISLGRYIYKYGEKGECSYCGRKDVFVMQIDRILKRISVAIDFYYESPENYPSLQGWNYYAEDIIEDDDLELTEANDTFLNDLKLAVRHDDRIWIRKRDLWTPFSDALKSSWDNFSEIVKHQWRYTYFLCGNSIDDPATYSPLDTLDIICEIIKSRSELITELPALTSIFRARKCEKKTEISAKALGSAPIKYAGSNRFSPEGISMFYGSLDKETPVKEADGDSNSVILGEFYNSKSIKLLDLTHIPEVPKLYDDDYVFIPPLNFLHKFAETISKKNNSKNSIEYIPTQVFTEYIRFQGLRKLNIKGIKYNSAQNEGGINLVLFYTNDDCIDETDHNNENDCLVLRSFTTTQTEPIKEND